jgi:hypothetical protein
MDDDELVATLDVEDDELDEESEDEEQDGPDDSPSEMDRIDPQSEIVTLRCGIDVKVLPLRTRQLFKMLRIITHGAGQALSNAGLDFSQDAAVFMQKLISVVLFSIPDAEQETIDFIQSMVEPAGLVDKAPRDLSKQERETNVRLWTEVNTELWNPDPSDTLDLVERIVRREAKDIQALGNRVRGFLELASKTGQLSEPAASGPARPASNSSAGSRASSTSSRTSTAGRTSKSSTSRSDGSGKSAQPSRRGSGRKNVPVAP